MNGEPLPIEHGFPVRMVVPGLYGYVSATKWVTELKVTTFAEDRATGRRWAGRPAARSRSPPGSTCRAGAMRRRRHAWWWPGWPGPSTPASRRSRCRSTPDPWQPAQLAETVGPDTWRQWRFDWAATSGTHTITVRATDADGTAADRRGRARRLPTGRPDITRSRSRSAEPTHQARPVPTGTGSTTFVSCGSRWPGRAAGEARVALVPELGRQAGRGGLRGRRRDRGRPIRVLSSTRRTPRPGPPSASDARTGPTWWSACNRWPVDRVRALRPGRGDHLLLPRRDRLRQRGRPDRASRHHLRHGVRAADLPRPVDGRAQLAGAGRRLSRRRSSPPAGCASSSR